jgi:hypothetical protein
MDVIEHERLFNITRTHKLACRKKGYGCIKTRECQTASGLQIKGNLVTSVPPYGTFSLIKNNILHQSKIYKNHFENSNF